jgi:hypothetical protein
MGDKVVWQNDGSVDLGDEIDLGEEIHQILPASSTTELSLEFPWRPAYSEYGYSLIFNDRCKLDKIWIIVSPTAMD